MLYLGTACGAAIGGAAAGSVGFEHLAWVGMPFAAAGLLLLLAGRARRRRRVAEHRETRHPAPVRPPRQPQAAGQGVDNRPRRAHSRAAERPCNSRR